MGKFSWATWKYKILAGVAILVALAIAVYAAHSIGKTKGYNEGKNISTEVINRYETEKRILQQQLTTAQGRINTRVVVEYKDRIVYQDRIVTQNRDIIRTVVKDRPVNQTVSKGWIATHNAATEGRVVNPQDAANSEPSGVSDPEVLERINDNYGIAQRNATQLEQLQKWVEETWEAINAANKSSNRK